MDMKLIVCCLVALLLGMLLTNMFSNFCGCKTVEGQTGNNSASCESRITNEYNANTRCQTSYINCMECSKKFTECTDRFEDYSGALNFCGKKFKNKLPTLVGNFGSNKPPTLVGNFGSNKPPTEVIGFIQSGVDEDGFTGFWYPSTEDIDASNYTVLVEGFTVNYPYCWGTTPDNFWEKSASSHGGVGNPFAGCIDNAGNPLLVNGNPNEGSDAWYNPSITCDNYVGEIFGGPNVGAQGPSVQIDSGQPGGENGWNPEYQKFWTRLHSPDPKGMRLLRQSINRSQRKPLLLTSIGGWFMGGSTEGGDGGTPKGGGMSPIGVCLQDPGRFARAMYIYLTEKMVTEMETPIYDGFDIDIETNIPFGMTGTDGSTEIAEFVKQFKEIDNTAQGFKISTSPRLVDIIDSNGIPGFMGNTMKILSRDGIYFDFVNPQCYNDTGAMNIPGTGGVPGTTGVRLINTILDQSNGYIGPNTTVSVGVLSQNSSGGIDTGGAPPGDDNPGVSNENLSNLWNNILEGTNNPSKLGLMNWYANISNKPKPGPEGCDSIKVQSDCTADGCLWTDEKCTTPPPTEYTACLNPSCDGFNFSEWANGLFGKNVSPPPPPSPGPNTNFCGPPGDDGWGNASCSLPCPSGKKSECTVSGFEECYGNVDKCSSPQYPPGSQYACSYYSPLPGVVPGTTPAERACNNPEINVAPVGTPGAWQKPCNACGSNSNAFECIKEPGGAWKPCDGFLN